MKHVLLTIIIVLVISIPAHAEIEKIAIPCESGFCFHWWPKLPAVDGWHHDREHSLYYSFNAQAPIGETFSNAKTVIYANAPYKPRMPEVKNLQQFIEEDQLNFTHDFPGVEIREVNSLATGDGQKLRSFTYSPAKTGSWEQVTYGEEGEFYLVFTVSSRTKAGLAQSIADYKEFIRKYKSAPNPPIPSTPQK